MTPKSKLTPRNRNLCSSCKLKRLQRIVKSQAVSLLSTVCESLSPLLDHQPTACGASSFLRFYRAQPAQRLAVARQPASLYDLAMVLMKAGAHDIATVHLPQGPQKMTADSPKKARLNGIIFQLQRMRRRYLTR